MTNQDLKHNWPNWPKPRLKPHPPPTPHHSSQHSLINPQPKHYIIPSLPISITFWAWGCTQHWSVWSNPTSYHATTLPHTNPPLPLWHSRLLKWLILSLHTVPKPLQCHVNSNTLSIASPGAKSAPPQPPPHSNHQSSHHHYFHH